MSYPWLDLQARPQQEGALQEGAQHAKLMLVAAAERARGCCCLALCCPGRLTAPPDVGCDADGAASQSSHSNMDLQALTAVLAVLVAGASPSGTAATAGTAWRPVLP